MSIAKRIRLFLICFLLIFSAIGEASAASYYMATNGSDSYNCSISYPCKTIENTSARLVAGDILYLRGGTYALGSATYVNSSIAGTAQAPITIKNYPGETPILGGGNSGLFIVGYIGSRYIVLDGLEFSGYGDIAIKIINASNMTIRNCYFHDSMRWGGGVVSISNDVGGISSDFLIENNRFENNGRTIDVNQDHDVYISRGIINATIRNNFFKDSAGGAMVHVYSGSSPRPHDVSIYNNIFYLTRGLNRAAIQVYSPSTSEIYNISLYNNTIYANCSGATTCFAIDFSTYSAVNNVAKNNIIYYINSSANNSILTILNKAVFDYNLYYPTKDSNDTGAHSFVGNPLFVNIGTQDFYLSSSSPAINRGVTLGTVTTDFDGVTRSQGTAYDIGAYEFTGGTSVTTQNVNTPPVAAMKVNSITGYTVSITDASTDNAAFPTSAITVNWGDGAISTGNNRATFSHTYTTAATFIITLTAKDAGGLYKSVLQNVTVPQNVNPAPMAVMKVNSITGYTVSITDASTDNAAFPTNAITVNWGDGATSTGNNRATFSHTYAIAGTFKITLTVKDSAGLSSSVSQNVTVSQTVTSQSVNSAPVAVMTINSVSGYTVSITDASTDNAAFPTNAITVKWGDGASSTGNNRATFSHTYTTIGTFNIVLTAKDANDLYSSVMQDVPVQQNSSITVNLSPALSSSATFILKQNGITRATGTGTTSYVFSNLNTNSYQVQIYKSGYTFDGDPVTAGSQNPVDTTIGSNRTVTFTHTP